MSSSKKGIRGRLYDIKGFAYLSDTKLYLMTTVFNTTALPVPGPDQDAILTFLGTESILTETVSINDPSCPKGCSAFETKTFCMLRTNEATGIAVHPEEDNKMWHDLLLVSNFIISYLPAKNDPSLWCISFQYYRPSYIRLTCLFIDDPLNVGRRGGKSIGAASVGR